MTGQYPAISGQQPSSGLVCTYSSCSNSNPCNTGTCNNGYCCSSGSSSSTGGAIIESESTNHARTNLTLSTADKGSKKTKVKGTKRKPAKTSAEYLTRADDWPIGPPGYGFPQHLANLDSVLVQATGDGNSCAGGYSSGLVCAGGECPPGLFCDHLLDLCCPLILPLTDANNPTKPKARRPIRAHGPCCVQQAASNNCNGCVQQQAPQVISIPSNSCPGGGYSVGSCSSGYCAAGYSCIQGSCCPSYSQPSVRVFTCPSGGQAVGSCISGSCATGYSCVQNNCCPSTTTQNPFVCPDGTQAAGGCVNGACGTGYTCSNGLCCDSTSSTVRCLDGSEAVGACIPSCQGNQCGGATLSYYCGSGYTCTTGNICCPVNSCPNGGEVLGPTVNGLCPTGYVAQGSVCCSQTTCPDGSVGTPTVNGLCPSTLTLTNGLCCGTTTAATTVSCTNELSIGPCVNGGCVGNLGYLCDTATSTLCCPVVNYNDTTTHLGPGVDGLCPQGFAIVYIPGVNIEADGTNPGTCVNLQSIPGICAETAQSGPCVNGGCSTGFTCFTAADVCCPTAAFRRLRPNQMTRPNLAYGQPLHNFMPPRDQRCPDGSSAGGACINGLCGVGHECHNGLCCPPQNPQNLRSTCPNGQTAVSGCFRGGSCGSRFECVSSLNLCCPPGGNDVVAPAPQSLTVRPIGARCMQDMECVGHNEGLSMCHAGVCQCSPIAYSQGIACVRRKALNLRMQDSPIVDEKKEEKEQ